MIKTVNVGGTQIEIQLTGGCHVHIENRGEGTVYVSKEANVVADGDEVIAIDGGTSKNLQNVATFESIDCVADYYGTIYAIADSDTKIEITTTSTLMGFNSQAKGGGAVKELGLIGVNCGHTFVSMSNVIIEDL